MAADVDAGRPAGEPQAEEPVLAPQPVGIPVPQPSMRSEPYWEGCRRHELRFVRCGRCGHVGPRPFTVCARCLAAEPRWETATGRGRLYSYTVVWRPQHPSFRVPYAPAIVELDEGYTMVSAVVGCTPGELRVGMPLTVEFHPASDEVTLPYFRPAD